MPVNDVDKALSFWFLLKKNAGKKFYNTHRCIPKPEIVVFLNANQGKFIVCFLAYGYSRMPFTYQLSERSNKFVNSFPYPFSTIGKSGNSATDLSHYINERFSQVL